MKAKLLLNMNASKEILEAIGELERKGFIKNGMIDCDESQDKVVMQLLDKIIENGKDE